MCLRASRLGALHPGGLGQLTYAISVGLVAFLGQLLARPYKTRLHNLLADLYKEHNIVDVS